MRNMKRITGIWLLTLLFGTLAAVCSDVGLSRATIFLTVMAILHFIFFLIGFFALKESL